MRYFQHIALCALFGSVLGAAACVSSRGVDAVSVTPLKVFALNPENYRGRVIRTCGEKLETHEDAGRKSWTLSAPRAFGHHPATVNIFPCESEEPTLDDKSCITGRVALSDGSLDIGDEIIVGDPGDANPWRLHAQCRAK